MELFLRILYQLSSKSISSSWTRETKMHLPNLVCVLNITESALSDNLYLLLDAENLVTQLVIYYGA